MGEVDAGEDAPRVAADGTQRVLGEPRHERFVDRRLDAMRVHDRVPGGESMADGFRGRLVAAHRAE